VVKQRKSSVERLHEEWGKRLRQTRRVADLTQVQLAEAVGVEQNTISRYENGLAPSDGMKLRLCLALDVDVEEIYCWPLGIMDMARMEAA
jgi:transcriptional regulator with XRE-family HTH domain